MLAPSSPSVAPSQIPIGFLPSTDGDDVDVDDLPMGIYRAAAGNPVGRVLDWLGPPPVPGRRLNAKCREKVNRTWPHEAQFENHTELMRPLLQCGAKVDPPERLWNGPVSAVLFLHEARRRGAGAAHLGCQQGGPGPERCFCRT